MWAEVVGADSPCWGEMLASIPHDVYQLPEYVRFAAAWQEPGEPCAFLAAEEGQRLLIPMIVRPVDPALAPTSGTLFDATCPRDYPGPLLALDATARGGDFLERALDAFLHRLRQRRIVSAFLRLHPLFELPAEPLRRVGELVEHQESISVDLTLSHEELWRQTRRNHRRDINRARALGYTVGMDERWDHFDDFVVIYHQTMEQLGATAFWQLPADYFRELRQVLGDRLHLCVAERDGEVASAIVFTEVGGIVESLLGGTRTAFRADSPMKTIYDFGRAWAKERGNHVLHLGGSVTPGDSLFDFKLGLSPRRHPVLSWRVVADETAYESLVAAWQARHGTAADARDGFFPTYRKGEDGKPPWASEASWTER